MRESTRWLIPAFLAPLSSLAAIATLLVVFHVPPGERLANWMALMTFGVLLGGIQSTALISVDTLAAAVRLRRLPLGLRAWGAGAVAPVLALLFALLVPLPFERHPWLSLFLAAVAAAVPVRLFFGARWRAP